MYLGRSIRFSDYEAQILIVCVCVCGSAAENVARGPELDKNLFYQGEIQTLGANIQKCLQQFDIAGAFMHVIVDSSY